MKEPPVGHCFTGRLGARGVGIGRKEAPSYRLPTWLEYTSIVLSKCIYNSYSIQAIRNTGFIHLPYRRKHPLSYIRNNTGFIHNIFIFVVNVSLVCAPIYMYSIWK